MAGLTLGILAAGALAAPTIAQTIISENQRKDAKRAANRQLMAQEALLSEQQRRSSTLATQQQQAAERDARLQATRARRGRVGRAGQGSFAVLGTPIAGGAATSGKTLLGL